MDSDSKKRLRSDDSPDSSSEGNRNKALSESSVYSKSSRSLHPPFPIPSLQDSSSGPLKKPKLWDYDHKKSSQSIQSGMLQCIKMIQDFIKHNDYNSLLSSLRKLANELTMSNDEQLSILPVDLLVDSMVNSLNLLENPEIALQAIICINYLLESNHSAVIAFVKAGTIGQLTSKVMNIDYIDVAEFAVKALEKISSEFPTEVLREGFLAGIFPVLNFFEQGVQKKILGIVLNIAKGISSQDDFLNYVLPCIPAVIGLLENKGRDFLHQIEKSIEIMTALNESTRMVGIEDALSAIVTEQKLIPLLFTSLNEQPVITVKVLKLFSCMCRNSLGLTMEFFLDGAVFMRNVMEKGIHEGNCLIVTESLQLINSIIPNDHDRTRTQYFSENNEFLIQILDIAIPRIAAIFEILTKKNVKILYLDIIYNLIAHSPPQVIASYSEYSQFLSSLLVEKDSSILKSALKIINMLYEKIPEQISTSFIRGGVVQRFKALKYPENLRNVTEDKYSDPLEFEHFLVNYRRSRAYSEHQEHSSSHSRPRLLSECRDNNYDQKKEIISMSKSVLDKHNNCHNHSALTTMKVLKNLTGELEKLDSDNANEIWKELGQVIDELTPTAFEFSSSLLGDCIWNWMTSKKEGKFSIARYHNFIGFLSQHCKNGQLYFAKVLLLVMNTFGYLETITSGHEKQSSRHSQQKIRISMQYAPEEEVSDQIATRHNYFSSIGKFSISPDSSCPISTLKSMIARVENKDDFSFFKEAIKDEPMELEEDHTANLIKIRLFFNDRELTDDMSAGDAFTSCAEGKILKFQYCNLNTVSQYISKEQEIFQEFIYICSHVGIPSDMPVYPYLRLLKFLFCSSYSNPFASHSIHSNILRQPLVNYISPKLNSIAFKCFQEPISLSRRNLPQWLRDMPKHSWFLFSYSTRLKILDNFRFIQNDSYRLPRQKLRVDRENILEGAMMIMNDTSLLQQGILEIQYDNEVGTGNGPTLEFFTLVSEEIRKLPIWRNSTMLFPAPEEVTRTEYFKFIGKVIGKSIIDRRYVELPLSRVFWKLVLKQKVTIQDLYYVDLELFRTMSGLQELTKQYKANPEIVKYNGSTVEEMYLFFTLPGYCSIELIPNGKHVPVTIENLEEYINLVTQHTLLQVSQISAFKDGLSSLIPLEILLGFSSEELEEIVCGSCEEVWDLDILKASIKPAHGYTESSTTFQSLLTIMSEFTKAQQHKFLQFATGCPRLPLGGFFGLVPCLTVVRKEEGEEADKYLPSVMTCQNYLKIPNYSSETILRKNLNLALEEGYQAFHLS